MLRRFSVNYSLFFLLLLVRNIAYRVMISVIITNMSRLLVMTA